jgi:hypothetical protein
MRTTIGLAILLSLGLGPFMEAAEKHPSADALIDHVIRQPGTFDQMCDPAPVMDPHVPLPLFSLLLNREVHVTPENLAKLSARRPEVVAALKARLASLDLRKQVPNAPEFKIKNEETMEVADSGVHPRQISSLLFEIIVGLDAVETLPELLSLEEQLRGLLAAADANAKVSPPPIRLDADLTEPPAGGKLSRRDEQLEKGRIVQRELLSVMLQLLRRQRYGPVLHSDFEKVYAAAIKSRAKKDDLREYKTAAEAKEKQPNWIHFDPICNVPVVPMIPPPTVPFSAEVRDRVRGLAQQFLKEVPPAKWKTAPETP